MSQLLEKKMKIRGGKKRHINFPYFLTGANRLNKLFIKASSYESALRKKDKFQKKVKNHFSWNFLFFCQVYPTQQTFYQG